MLYRMLPGSFDSPPMCGSLRTAAADGAAGFTLIELLVVMIIVAILVAVAAPRFFSRSDFEGPAFAQELASAARYAQKLAVASGCGVQFVTTASSYALKQPANADCTGGFTRTAVHPATGGDFSGTAPNGIGVTGSLGTITFKSRGVPDAVGSFGVSGKAVVVTAGSGYVEVQ